MNDHDQDLLHEINRLLDESQISTYDFLNELARSQPIASSNVKARIEDRLMSGLAQRKSEHVKANGHFELNTSSSDMQMPTTSPRRRTRQRLPLTMAATLLIVLFAGIMLVLIDGRDDDAVYQSRSELLTESPMMAATQILTEYTVQDGDTCESIATAFSVQVENLMAVNAMPPDCRTLRIGQVLMIPMPVTTTTIVPTATNTRTQRPSETPIILSQIVRQGDTCQSIALRMNIAQAELIAANNLDDECSTLQAGQVLTFPLRYYTSTPYQTVISTDNFVPVVIAREDLQAGMLITEQNVGVVYYPRELFPLGALSDPLLAYGRAISRDVSQFVPILMTPSLNDAATPFEIQVAPTECPPVVQSGLGIVSDAQSSIELSLDTAFAEPLEVVLAGYSTFQFETNGRCPTVAEPFGMRFQINVPSIPTMTEAAIIESIVYAFPAFYVPNVPIGDTRRTVDSITVTIGEEDAATNWTIDLLDLRNARQADLHGEELMTVLGISDSIAPQSIPTVSSTVMAAFDCPNGFTYDAVLNADHAIENALSNTLPDFVEVFTDSTDVVQSSPCVTRNELLAVHYQIFVPNFAFMTDTDVIEQIIYAYPETYLPRDGASTGQYGTITINYGEGQYRKTWSFGLLEMFNARQADLHGQELMDALELGFVEAPTLGPTATPNPQSTPTIQPVECLTHDELQVTFGAVQTDLQAALPIGVTVYVSTLADCVTAADSLLVNYGIGIPTTDAMTDTEILDTIVYAFPTEYLTNQALDGISGLVFISIAHGTDVTDVVSIITNLNDLYNVRQQGLHGRVLVDALGVNMLSNPPSVFIPVSQEISDAITVGDVVAAEIFFDVYEACFAVESLPEAVQHFCQVYSQDAAEDGLIGIYETPLLAIAGTARIDGVPQLVIRADAMTAEIINWLQEQETIEQINISGVMSGDGDDSAAACLSDDDIQTAFESSQVRVQSAMDETFDVVVHVEIVPPAYCVTALDQMVASYQLNLPVIAIMSDTQIIETIVYAFPTDLLPDQPYVGGLNGDLVVVVGSGDDSTTWTMDLFTLFNVQQQGLRGQLLIDALGTELQASIPLYTLQLVTIPIPEDLIEDNPEFSAGVVIEFQFDGAEICGEIDAAPDAVRAWCATVPASISVNGFNTFETPLLGLTSSDGVGDDPTIVISAEPDLAEVIRWLRDHNATYTLINPLSESLDLECLTDEEFQTMFESSRTRLQTALETVFDVDVEVKITSEINCLPSQEEIPVSYEVTLDGIDGNVSNMEIVETIVYAFPPDLLPEPPSGGVSGSLSLIVANRPDVWSVDLFTVFNVRRQDMHDQLLMDALGIDMSGNRQVVFIPMEDGTTDLANSGDAVTLQLTFDVQLLCFGDEFLPVTVQSICSEYSQPEDGMTGIYETPLVATGGRAEVNGVPNLIVRADMETAEVLGWMLDHDTVGSIMVNGLSGETLAIIGRNQVAISIPVWPELAETLRVGDRVTVRFAGADFDAVCNPTESVPNLIKQECESSFRSFNTRTISFTTPSLMVSALNLAEGMTSVSLAADSQTAEAIDWLQAHGVVNTIRLNRDLDSNTVWIAAECPTQESLQSSLDIAEANLQTILEDAFEHDVEIDITGVEICPDLSTPFDIWYRVMLSPTTELTPAEIIQTVVYAIPYEMLPQGIFTQSFDGITIVIGEGENTQEFTINFTTLRNARDRGFGGQELMDALGINLSTQSSFGPMPSDGHIDIPYDPTIVPLMVVGETLALELVSDSRTICEAEDVIEIVEQWWRCIPVPQNDTFTTRIPLVLDAISESENGAVATFTTHESTATLITWLLAHQIDYRLIGPPSALEQPASTTRAILPVPQQIVEQFAVGDHVTVIFRVDDAMVCGETAVESLQSLCRNDNIDSDGRHVLQTSTLLMLGLHHNGDQSTFTVEVNADFIDTFRTLLDSQAIYSLRIHEGEYGSTGISLNYAPDTQLAPFFSPSVQHWADDIDRWADEADLNPNLVALTMQIESCGHPSIGSEVGAVGLFQVLPELHLNDNDDPFDPDTNAAAGLEHLNSCLAASRGIDGEPQIGLAMVCYNGGPALMQDEESWGQEAQNYYNWSEGIWSDVSNGNVTSTTLQSYLDIGGQDLCDAALETLQAH
jgi:LysM repeat protein